MLLLVPPGAQAWVLRFTQSSEGPLNSTGAEGRMGGVSRPLRGQASRGRYRETLGRKERIGRVLERRKELGPGALESLTAQSPCPGLAPQLSACRDRVQSPSWRGLGPQPLALEVVHGPLRDPCPHQLQLLIQLCFCLARSPCTSPEAPLGLFSHLYCLSISRLARRIKSGHLEQELFVSLRDPSFQHIEVIS